MSSAPCYLPVEKTVQHVTVIGAGVAGLQTARALLRAGFGVTVLEREADVGGVWLRYYFGYGLQVPWEFYQFPEFPVDPQLRRREFPPEDDVRDYIRSYVQHFQLRPHIKFKCRMMKLNRKEGGWEVLYLDLKTKEEVMLTTDFVVICTGLFSEPKLPNWKGMETFRGHIIHSRFFQDRSIVEGKHLLIVGGGKTAVDCATEVAMSGASASVTWLFRQAHWPFPRVIANKFPMEHLVFSQLPLSLLPPYYTDGRLKSVLHNLTRPLKTTFWRCTQRLIKKQFQLEGPLLPPFPIEDDMLHVGIILDAKWNEAVQAGMVKPLMQEIDVFLKDGVLLKDRTYVPAEVVLCCTGYGRTYDYLEPSLRSKLHVKKDGLYLYRGILAPHVPGLAFVGSEVATFNNILTHGLQAEWLARVLSGQMALPSVNAMMADIRQQQMWRRKHIPVQRHRSSVYMLYMMRYHQQLLKDMELKLKAKGNLFTRCVIPYTARDYARQLYEPKKRKPVAAEKTSQASGMPSLHLHPYDSQDRHLGVEGYKPCNEHLIAATRQLHSQAPSVRLSEESQGPDSGTLLIDGGLGALQSGDISEVGAPVTASRREQPGGSRPARTMVVVVTDVPEEALPVHSLLVPVDSSRELPTHTITKKRVTW